MWTLKQIMEGGAMGVQITISGKLRGDRSAFEKHAQGILPRAGHHAEVIVEEDIAHVKTAMGLIGVRIRIAKKEKLVPEFEMRVDKTKKGKQDSRPPVKIEEILIGDNKVEVIKVVGKKDNAESESAVIEIESKNMETLETLEEEEAKLK